MKVSVTWRELTVQEATILSQETRVFPDLGTVSVKRWIEFKKLPVVLVDGKLAGTLGFYDLGAWIKLGPFVILKAHQGKGIGRYLFQKVLQKFNDRNLYIGSSHPAVWQLARKAAFIETTKFFSLPWEIRHFLAVYFLKRLSVDYIVDATKKIISSKRREYRYFLKRK